MTPGKLKLKNKRLSQRKITISNSFLFLLAVWQTTKEFNNSSPTTYPYFCLSVVTAQRIAKVIGPLKDVACFSWVTGPCLGLASLPIILSRTLSHFPHCRPQIGSFKSPEAC
jgi:hypothetical protein